MTETIPLAIVEDDAGIRAGWKAIVNRLPGYRCVGDYGSAEEALEGLPGVLPEVVGENPTRIAIGCGVNIAHAPEGTPYPVTSLGAGLAVSAVLAKLDEKLSRRLAQWDEGRGFAAIRADWAARALGLGGSVTATSGTRQLTGTFKGLAVDGALMLEEAEGTIIPIHSGEVSFAELEALRRKHA